jgi:ubiquinone/menaquinone biosynthesis C-methylase UbiE
LNARDGVGHAEIRLVTYRHEFRRRLDTRTSILCAVTEVVAAGYDAVYASWSSSKAFHDIWAENAVEGDIASGFEHLNFARLSELERVRDVLDLRGGDRVVDLACGAGGPGVWVAHETDAVLVGVDLSRVGTRLARERAAARQLSGGSFVVGSIDRLPLADACAVGVMSLDSLQYVPDKRAMFAEVARVLVEGGRLAFTAFEVDPGRVRGVPVMGVDPIRDYAPLLREVGLTVELYEETPRWRDRLVAAYSAVIAAEPDLRPQVGDNAMDALMLEMSLTLQIDPYPRRVFAVARLR